MNFVLNFSSHFKTNPTGQAMLFMSGGVGRNGAGGGDGDGRERVAAAKVPGEIENGVSLVLSDGDK